jgi:hypothetical protein
MNEERDRNMPTLSARTRLAILLFSGLAALLFVALSSALDSATSTAATARMLSPVHSSARASDYQPETLPTFVDLPQGAAETYPGSGMFKAPISQPMSGSVDKQTQENWEKYRITKESNLGLPLGSVYLRARNSQYVELAIYERAAFTIFKGKPARQILSTILFEGRVQVTEDEFIKIPEYIRGVFAELPIAGEGAQGTPLVGQVAKMLSTEKSKAVDGSWTVADKLMRWNGQTEPVKSSFNVESLPLGEADNTTGHKIPLVVGAGLTKMFNDKLVENVGLPLSPPMWIAAKIDDQIKPTLVQVFQRAIVTYNPANDEANRVQVGLGGAIALGGLSVTTPPPTPTPLPSPTADRSDKELRINDRATFTIYDPATSGSPTLRIRDREALKLLLDRVLTPDKTNPRLTILDPGAGPAYTEGCNNGGRGEINNMPSVGMGFSVCGGGNITISWRERNRAGVPIKEIFGMPRSKLWEERSALGFLLMHFAGQDNQAHPSVVTLLRGSPDSGVQDISSLAGLTTEWIANPTPLPLEIVFLP